MNIIKRVSIGLLAAILGVVAVPMIPAKPALAAAQEKAPTSTGWDVYVDSNGDVVVTCNDKRRTSSIYYKTVGLTFSRGQFNPSAKKLAKGAATEFFYVPIEPSKVSESDAGHGRVQTVFKIPYATMKANIGAASGEWLQEILDAEKFGGTAYVRVDCDMRVYHGSNTDGYRYMNDPPKGPYDDEKRDLNPREIQAAEPWSAGANTGLRTHFHRWLPIMSAKPLIKQPVFLDHHVTYQNEGGVSGPGAKNGTTLKNYGDYSGDPAFAGGNANLEGYNAAEGIPSTKTVTGYAEASPWYGGIDVWASMG